MKQQKGVILTPFVIFHSIQISGLERIESACE